ncbi:CEACAM-binding trimeric autotransporter adhesin CbpF [Fusobacterium sp. oral taxon 203]|uniref:CEACAM-binding trimeric autotransporter adhesin CbpF n=1 Tax=Fusobacterium sp. oral taxon 203 TaxID=671211 RepID=UPI000B929868|nr:CEACAM-binding trimeric autotransporter adhesin CbpF [Fusobacterium sp. oral taxon 203]ASS38675.1 cell surface protein [Fusobacterium sp. oral taxon 203]
MKKFVSLKLIVFSFILVVGSVSFSAPVFQGGTGTDSTVAGVDNIASEEKSSAFGTGNNASGKFSSAFGYKNIASRLRSSAFGTGNKAIGEDSSAFGSLNIASGKFSSAFGSQYEVTGNSSGAFGVGEFNGSYQYKNEGNNSYMIGNKNKIASGSDDNFILGNNVHIGGGINNSVALGNNSTVSASNTVSVGSSTLKRKIVNVGDGEISASSTDAVTGRQLYSGNGIDTAAWQNKLNVTRKNDYKDANDIDVNKWRTKLGVGSGGGGGAPVDAYTKSEADNKFANKTDLDNYTKKDDYKDANGIDVDKWKAKLGTGTANIENLRNEVNEKIDNVKDEVRTVGSLSAALAGLHPMQYDPKAPVQVMAALGHYKDKQSVAVGASYYFNDRFMMSTGIALSGEKRTETMANVGFTLKLGKGSGVTYNETPQYVVQNEVKRLTVENQELKERLRNLEEKLEMLLKNK